MTEIGRSLPLAECVERVRALHAVYTLSHPWHPGDETAEHMEATRAALARLIEVAERTNDARSGVSEGARRSDMLNGSLGDGYFLGWEQALAWARGER